jgi:hypothetical protein
MNAIAVAWQAQPNTWPIFPNAHLFLKVEVQWISSKLLCRNTIPTNANASDNKHSKEICEGDSALAAQMAYSQFLHSQTMNEASRRRDSRPQGCPQTPRAPTSAASGLA